LPQTSTFFFNTSPPWLLLDIPCLVHFTAINLYPITGRIPVPRRRFVTFCKIAPYINSLTYLLTYLLYCASPLLCVESTSDKIVKVTYRLDPVIHLEGTNSPLYLSPPNSSFVSPPLCTSILFLPSESTSLFPLPSPFPPYHDHHVCPSFSCISLPLKLI